MKSGRVLADVAAAFADEGVHVDAVAVQVAGEDGAVVFLRPVAALINEHADVGVAAAEFESVLLLMPSLRMSLHFSAPVSQ
jgi:hypothetical protein